MSTGRITNKATKPILNKVNTQLDVDSLLNKLTLMVPRNIGFREKKEIYNTFFESFKKAENIENVLSLLHEMLHTQKLYPDKRGITQLIIKFTEYDLIDKAQIVYEQATRHALLSVQIHRAMFWAAFKKEDMQAVSTYYEMLMQENEKTEQRNKEVIEVKVHNTALKAYGANKNFDLAERLYNRMWTEGIDDTFTHNIMIDIMGANNIEVAIFAYENALNKGSADKITYNNMMKAAFIHNKLSFAVEVYNNAISNNQADDFTYNIAIDLAGKFSWHEMVENAYRNAINSSFANKVTFASMINVAWKNNWIDLAHDAYVRAASLGLMDNIMYDCMISVYVENGMLKNAEAVYKLRKITLAIKKINGEFEVDLHELSYGTAYCGLKELIENNMTDKNSFSLNIIYGKGLHSKNTGEVEHPVKKSVYDLMENLNQQYDIFIKESEENFGIASCVIQSREKKLAYSPKQFKGPDTPNKMLPDAKEFKPGSP